MAGCAMKLSEIIGMEVVSSSGSVLGQIVDLRSAGEPEHQEQPYRLVTEIIIGRAGWMERLGFRAVKEEVISWSRIASIEGNRVTLTAG